MSVRVSFRSARSAEQALSNPAGVVARVRSSSTHVRSATTSAATYVLPSAGGYSAEMYPSTVEEFAYQNGSYWAGRSQPVADTPSKTSR
jgi:hypothetical protein